MGVNDGRGAALEGGQGAVRREGRSNARLAVFVASQILFNVFCLAICLHYLWISMQTPAPTPEIHLTGKGNYRPSPQPLEFTAYIKADEKVFSLHNKTVLEFHCKGPYFLSLKLHSSLKRLDSSATLTMHNKNEILLSFPVTNKTEDSLKELFQFEAGDRVHFNLTKSAGGENLLPILRELYVDFVYLWGRGYCPNKPGDG
ncbi:uncharacterized protein LOC121330769 [Polyodon spathula]|uniref:uncharacterized protein LOC121330769 n=1 Tax=Polyodon spathula TaxID=7913 RepID=UPI001B7EE1C9|nr:uncharacterized protein LOC121330769 [Polyodon spathula]